MAKQEHLNILKQGVEAWNAWIKKNKEVMPDLRDADLSGLDLCNINLKEARLKGANLSRAKLRKAQLDNAYMRRANLSGADLTDASLSGANLRHATLRKAKLKRAYLRRVDFSYVDLTGADLTGSVLEYARLVDTNLQNTILKSCFIYGASVWNITGIPKEQSNLVITPRRVPTASRNEPTITVDDLEMAQFIYLLLNHNKLRNTINAVTRRGVLLLGRFGGGGLAILRSVATRLKELGYLPIIFDFEKPDDRDYTETIQILAGLSKFVIVDLSGPSVPQELRATILNIKVPYVPIIEQGRKVFSMFSDYNLYPWVVRPPLKFKDEQHLLEMLPTKVVSLAEKRHKRIRRLLGGKP